jgi:hypothetical protein
VIIQITLDGAGGGARRDSEICSRFCCGGISRCERDECAPIQKSLVLASLSAREIVIITVGVFVVDPCGRGWLTTIAVGGDNTVGDVTRI